MSKKPARAILYGSLLFCVAFCFPQIFTSPVRLYRLFARDLVIFTMVLLFVTLLGLYLHVWLIALDERIRRSASSPRWLQAGLAMVVGGGLVLSMTMMTWNDERFNLEAARYLWQHGLGDYFSDYAEINGWLGRHHPPLLVLFYGLWYKLTGFSLLAGRLVNLAFAAGSAWLTFLWVRRLVDGAVASLAVVCLVFTPMWVFSSASALLDMPFLFLFLASLLAFEKFLQTRRGRYAALAGALMALTTLSRYNGLFLLPIWLVQLLADSSTRGLLKEPKTYLAALVPALLGLPWMALSLAQGTLAVQFARLSEFLLVAVVRPGGWFYLTEVLLPIFPIMMGIYTIPLLFYGLAAFWKVRSPGIKRLVFSCATYLGLVVLTLPNARYVLPAVPMLAAIASIGLWRLAANRQGMAAVLGVNLLCSACFVAFYTLETARKLIYIFY